MVVGRLRGSVHDYHVHSTYSDGDFLHRMVAAAEDAGLAGVGFADHCPISDRESVTRWRDELGFSLDLTYERRRRAIERTRERTDIEVYDAVEVDYHPDDESVIREFLSDAGFEYHVGSVHELRGHNVHDGHFDDLSEAERLAVVDEYFETVVALVEFGAFDILAHPDIVERNDALRGLATVEHYHDVATALAGSDTIPEINAGRIDRAYGEFHPNDEFVSVLGEYDVAVTLGTDAHDPTELRERAPALRAHAEEIGLTVTTIET